MSTDNYQLDVDDAHLSVEPEETEPATIEPAKTKQSKRRTIDNLQEERRLQNQLAYYEFDY
ncbi:PA3496 family putative envelope integrity protein [Pseudomonas syringae group genomosp. 7]|uniref:PA3496 family putative envelope integrity protein n=1 Tax=Pseudomonas syringae group genomosp. 7 TaxID=251699 RepID=UPI00376F781A